MKKINLYWLLTFFLFLIIFLPSILTDGMFLDGVTYSAISNNLANGHGDFFNLHYTKTIHAKFHEHPPLVFIIQSFFFKAFGSSFYTERVFGLFISLLTVFGIAKVWCLFHDKEQQKFNWVPIVIWLCVPLVMWSYRNNVLENTMGVFTLFASFFILKSLINNSWGYLVFGGVFIVFGGLSKGPVAFFPLVIPFIYGLLYKTKNYSLYNSFALFGVVILIGFVLFLLFPDLYNNITLYLNKQLIPSINNNREVTTANRFYILLVLLKELLSPIFALSFIVALAHFKKIKLTLPKQTILFGLIALAASVPLIISFKQRDFYLVPTIPFFALSAGCFLIKPIRLLTALISQSFLNWTKRIVVVLFIFFGGFVFISQKGNSRDKVLLEDVYKISSIIPEGSVISTIKQIQTNWLLIAYLSRIGYISLDDKRQHQYLLTKKEEGCPKGYVKIGVDLELFYLLKRASL
ncbi:MAG: glycosyltransferase family 39 protein [Flavobacteriales bacterium]|nr:glycosyltransferase family 39 protein [Flavobacteriales bacterium]